LYAAKGIEPVGSAGRGLLALGFATNNAQLASEEVDGCGGVFAKFCSTMRGGSSLGTQKAFRRGYCGPGIIVSHGIEKR